MKKYLLILILGFSAIGCDFKTPNGKFPAFLSLAPAPKFPAMTIPENFSPTPITSDEIKAMESFKNIEHKKGHDLIESKRIQIEGLKSLNESFNNITEEELKFLGPVEGYTPGMTIEEYSDQVIQQMMLDSEKFPVQVLKEFRYEIVSWVYRLQSLKQVCTPSTNEECQLLDKLSDKYLVLREKVIEITSKKYAEEIRNK
ncbi:hypothetical protein [Leptospira levettii]|uniref:Lipoprotein n=1 Tax=Leptospira levettii TaxID=2023178 RepID=A0ABY2MTY3_9LEPT|nr:hypothetical protein [Leptospira levettii]TGL75419.1 hypothetical protein EHQ60_00410 [Leptospira levettii]